MSTAIGPLLKHLRASALHDERLGFWRGVRAPFAGIMYLLTHPRALGLCLAPWAINLFVIFPIFLALGWWLLARPVLGLLPGEEEFLGPWLGSAAMMVLGPLIVVVSLVLALMVGTVVGAPFHDALGKQIEGEMLADRPELLVREELPFWAGVRLSIREATKRLGFFLPRLLLLLLLGLIPFIGPVLALVANVAFTAAFLTIDAFSQPMNRRQIPLEAKVGWMIANRRFALGFGLPMLLVPCAMFLMPPLATAAATRVYCQLIREGGQSPANPRGTRGKMEEGGQ